MDPINCGDLSESVAEAVAPCLCGYCQEPLGYDLGFLEHEGLGWIHMACAVALLTAVDALADAMEVAP